MEYVGRNKKLVPLLLSVPYDSFGPICIKTRFNCEAPILLVHFVDVSPGFSK